MKLAPDLSSGYQWVDRVCILNDHALGKSLQIPKVDIYSVVELTIVARSDSSHGEIAGLSAPRNLDQGTR